MRVIKGVQVYVRNFKSRWDYINNSTQLLTSPKHYHQFVKLYPDGEDRRSPIREGNGTTSQAVQWFRNMSQLPF